MTQSTSAKLMRIVSYGFILFAVVWGVAPYGPIGEPSRLLLDLLDWPLGDAAPAMNRSSMWLSSIGAGLTAALCIMLLGIVAPALERGDKGVVRIAVLAIVVWFVVDSAGSIAAGVASNAGFNVILLAAALAPLLGVQYEK